MAELAPAQPEIKIYESGDLADELFAMGGAVQPSQSIDAIYRNAGITEERQRIFGYHFFVAVRGEVYPVPTTVDVKPANAFGITPDEYRLLPTGALVSLGAEFENLVETDLGGLSVVEHGVKVARQVEIGRACLIKSETTIQENVEIGDDVTIGPATTIGEAAQVGEGSTVAGNAVIEKWAVVGPDSRIGKGARVRNHAELAERTIVDPGAQVKANQRIKRANTRVVKHDGPVINNG